MKKISETETTHYAITDDLWLRFYVGCAIASGAKLDDAIVFAKQVVEKMK